MICARRCGTEVSKVARTRRDSRTGGLYPISVIRPISIFGRVDPKITRQSSSCLVQAVEHPGADQVRDGRGVEAGQVLGKDRGAEVDAHGSWRGERLRARPGFEGTSHRG